MATFKNLQNSHLLTIRKEIEKQIKELDQDISISIRQFDQAWPDERFGLLPVSHFHLQIRHPNDKGWIFHVGSVSLVGDVRPSRDVKLALDILMQGYQSELDSMNSEK